LTLVVSGRNIVSAADQLVVGRRADSQEGLAEFHIRF
jgi:hypothetical protein